jgi:OmpA-OmpF porin, OOP family
MCEHLSLGRRVVTKKHLALIATIASILFSSSAFAAAVPRGKTAPAPVTNISVTPTIGGYVFGGSESLDPTVLYGVKLSYDIVGRTIADSIGVEATLNYFNTKSTAGAGNADGYLFRLDALFPFTPTKRLVPFAAVGFGGIDIDTKEKSDGSLLFNYGPGIKYFLEEWLALRADFRHLIVYNNTNTRNNFEFSIGLSYLFGKDHQKKTVAAPRQLNVPAIRPIEDIGNKPAPSVVVDLPLVQKLGLADAAALGMMPPKPQFPADSTTTAPTVSKENRPLPFLRKTAVPADAITKPRQ